MLPRRSIKMVYLKNFTILSREQEERILDSIRETCYTTRYPFNIFRYRDVPQLEFEPLTIFYGGNGSGKTTLLNIIAERLHLSRERAFLIGAAFLKIMFENAATR